MRSTTVPIRLALALVLAAAAASAGCRSEPERRARRMAALRQDAAAGIEAARRYCTARDSAVAAFERGEPGWEPTVEEVLRGPFTLDDYCAEDWGSHEHDEAEPDTAAGGQRDDGQRD